MKLPVYEVKRCGRCKKKKHLTHFQSYSKHRKKKIVTQCYDCRQRAARYVRNLKSKTSLCRKQWLDWKDLSSCEHCGESDAEVLQADHYRGKKIEEASFYSYWACNGGPEAQRKELQKCRCLCRYCHDVSTRQDYFKKQSDRKTKAVHDAYREQKNNYVNQEKLRRQGCALCDRKVTVNNVNCFKFDHGENYAKKNFGISNYIARNNCSFKKAKSKLKQEMILCRLLCSNCDWRETRKDLWGHKMPKPWQKEKDEYWNF